MLSLRNPLPNIITTWSSKRSSKSRAGSTSSSASEGDSSRASDGQQTPERRRPYRSSARSSYTVYAMSEREYDAAKLDLTESSCLPAVPVAVELSPSTAGDRRGNHVSSCARDWQVDEAEALSLKMRLVNHSRPKCKAAGSLHRASQEHGEEEEKPMESSQPIYTVTGCLSTVWEDEEDNYENEQVEKPQRKRCDKRFG